MSFNKTEIEWADYTLNPIVGCKHGCEYCYAKDINKRFRMIEKWEHPKFFPKRLEKKSPKGKIFVGSMADIFGKWVDTERIHKILWYCNENKQSDFMFLTKNPRGYVGFKFPRNCMLGVTMDTQNLGRFADFINFMQKDNFDSRYFISFEPLLEEITDKYILNNLHYFDLVIIGGKTGDNPFYPPKGWVNRILGHADKDRCLKNNLTPN